MEFKEFSKITRLNNVRWAITQKMHGTNASVWIIPNAEGGIDFNVGSRTRFITPDDDNYGFARFVYENKDKFIELLGPGVHFGEWAGPGINSGEGLTEKTFFLFDHWKYPEGRPLPPRTRVVPVLAKGGGTQAVPIEAVFMALKSNGSQAAPGFMRPEGIVVEINGMKMKHVFEAEETQWKKGSTHGKAATVQGDPLPSVDHLLQPIRLEKLLSRDEALVRGMPDTLPSIVRLYVADLDAEGQLEAAEDMKVIQKKALGKVVFGFVKAHIPQS